MYKVYLNDKFLKDLRIGSTCMNIGSQIFIDNNWYKLPDSDKVYIEDSHGFRYRRIISHDLTISSKLFIFGRI